MPLPPLRAQEILVVAEIGGGLPAGDLDHPCRQGIDEVAVVGDENQRPLIALERIEQDFLGLQVEVVGRLVEEQQVGGLEQQDGQGQAVALAAGEDTDLLVDIVAMEEEGAEQVAQFRHHVEGGNPGDLLQHRQLPIEGVGLVLGEVGQHQPRPFLALPFKRCFDPGQQAHQRRLAGAVGADQGHPLAAFDGQFDVAKHRVCAIAVAHPVELHRQAPALGRDRKLEGDALAFGGEVDALDLLQLLDAALHQRCLDVVVAKLVDERLDLGDLLVLAAFGFAQSSHLFVACGEVAGVATGIVSQFGVPDFDDFGDHLVKEEAVVGDEHHGERVVGQILFQPVAGGEVEMVGRLVEQQQVRPAQQQLGQGNAHLPTAREVLARLVAVGLRKTEPLEDPGHLGLHGIAAALQEFLLKMGVAVEVGRKVAATDALLQYGNFRLDGQQLVEGAARLGKEAAPGMLQAVLRQVADQGAAGYRDGAGVGFVLTGQQAQQGGLAGAVLAAQADPLARAQVPIDGIEHGLAGETLGDVDQLKHGLVIA